MTEEVLRFGLVDNQYVDAVEEPRRAGSLRCWVYDDRRATLLAGVEEGVERLRRRFERGQYHDRSDLVDRGPGLLGGERHCRARDVGDPVLTGLLFDDDERHPGCGARAASDRIGVDSFAI